MAQARIASLAFGGMPPALARIAEWLRGLRHDFADNYRPELHYMRGPGPKWHAKYSTRSDAA
jgi:hypothetical protein